MYAGVLEFWFEEIKPSEWFAKDLKLDELIMHRFAELHASANCCELFEWRATPQGRLAEIIVLDQFSRNMFRNLPASFASDPLSLALAQEAISVGADKSLTAIERSFLYMPFMHSESAVIHDVSVPLFAANGVKSSLKFAHKHKEIIDRFGRYPHRNVILGRLSTDAETKFLKQPGSSF